MEPVKPFSITTDVETSFTSVADIGLSGQNIQRQETPMKEPLATAVPSKTSENPSFDMPDAHIRSIEEQEAQKAWATSMVDEDDEPQFWLNMLETLEETDSFPSKLEMWIRSKTHVTTKLAIAHAKENQDTRTVEEIVPKELHDFLNVFSNKKATRFPKRKPYDHKIKTKPGFKPKRHKLYSLTPEEDAALKMLIDENLVKGCIRPSKSEMASSFFFVKKKDNKK